MVVSMSFNLFISSGKLMIFFSLVPAIFFRARLQRTLASQIHAIMVVRVFWERKATSFAAVLQGLQARCVKASPT